ncbi:hypothetical protein EfmJHP36_26280 [Enterococcus faecium]|nr:hypothetical protein EfmJHP36_26280 [Enterococcus faecium]
MCVTNFTESEQWDTVIEGNDDLLEKYMSGKSLEALELEQEESIRFQNCSLFPLYHGSAKFLFSSERQRLCEVFLQGKINRGGTTYNTSSWHLPRGFFYFKGGKEDGVFD